AHHLADPRKRYQAVHHRMPKIAVCHTNSFVARRDLVVQLTDQMYAMASGTFGTEESESSATVRERVTLARRAAAHRWREFGWLTNAEVPGHVLRQRFRLPAEVTAPVEAGLRMGRLSARGADRAIRVAWTICDLRGADIPSAQDVMQALNFRQRGAQ
ncbi:magnesium chelatase subunit ChlI family protein, partial [Nocardia cyriacigeorgica]